MVITFHFYRTLIKYQNVKKIVLILMIAIAMASCEDDSIKLSYKTPQGTTIITKPNTPSDKTMLMRRANELLQDSTLQKLNLVVGKDTVYHFTKN